MTRDDIGLRLLPSRPDPVQYAVSCFLTAKEAEGCAPRTLTTYVWCLDRFTAWLRSEGVDDVRAVTRQLVRRWLVALQREHDNSWTIHNLARVAKTWCRWLVDEEMLAADPFAKVQIPQPNDALLPAFSADDVAKLLKVANPREAAVVLVLLDTGLRASEFCALRVGDVDNRSGEVRVRQGKGGKDRVVFLCAKTRRALQLYRKPFRDAAPDAPLWPGAATSPHAGRALGVSGLQTLLKRLGERAGVEHCHPHTFRRTFALWSLDAGMNVYALQKLMGHADLKVLLRYLDLQREHLSRAHDEHGAVDHMLERRPKR
jgi:integrase/recombinase XerD